MDLIDIYTNYGIITLTLLVILSFIAGFVDAVVGGGGLIQIPALLISFPQTALPTIFGTNKIASLAGTSISAIGYSKRIKFNFKLLLAVSVCAGLSSFLGAKIVSFINVEFLKPFILAVLVAVVVYTFLKKDIGAIPTKNLSLNQQIIYGS